MADTRIEREPVCLVDGCPAPNSPDFHVPWCGHGLAGSHHHVVKRSQGGVDGWVVFICPRCHDDIDNGYTLEDAVLDFPALNQQRYYIYRDIGDKREYLCEKVVYPPFWEDNDGEVPPRKTDDCVLREVREDLRGLQAPRPRPASGEEHVQETATNRQSRNMDTEGRVLVLGQNLTFSQWAEKCKSIGSIRHSMGFLIGDMVILGEDAFGEKAWQYLSELGYEDRSIGNMVRVCRAIPPARRNAALTYSHHVVVYKLPEAEQDAWLAKAEGMTVKAFREAVHGVKEPPAKRYSVNDLRPLAVGWDTEAGPFHEVNLVFAFIDWLEEREGA